MENFLTFLHKYNNDIEKIFSNNLKNTLNILYNISLNKEEQIFLVGGIVRDIFLGKNSGDVDLVLKGDSQAFALSILDKFKVSKHRYTERFLTYNIFTKTGTNIDIASFREETYEYPGALPDVVPSSIENDYMRRDFTINSMYISFDKEAKLYDPLNGLKDIEDKIVRVIHDKSFEDDPTRIFRAIKFAARYNFTFDENTKRLLNEAMENRFLASISNMRLKNEIYMLLAEKNLAGILKYFREYGIFEFLNFPNPSDEDIEKLEEMINQPFFRKMKFDHKISKGNFILLFLIRELSYKEKREVLKTFELSEKNIDNILFNDGQGERLARRLATRKKDSEIYKLLINVTPFKILYLFFMYKSDKKKLKRFIFDLRSKNAIISGSDLLAAGFEENASMGKYIERCFLIQLDMEEPSKDEIIKILMEELKSNGEI